MSLELQELNAADFNLSLPSFDPGENDGLFAISDEERANTAPPIPEIPLSRIESDGAGSDELSMTELERTNAELQAAVLSL